MPAITLHNAEFAYFPQLPVLKGIELTVEDGDFIGLIGPNGSGKSTILKLINKTIRPMNGSIFVFDHDIHAIDHKSLAKLIGTVGQETNAPFAFTVEQIVLMGRSPHLSRWERESPVDIEIVKNAMEMTSISHLADRFISELSGGERQRVMIAQALAQQPKILLLDEPTSHLDIKHQLSILKMIRRLNKEGMTIVAVFHDLGQAGRYCGKLALVNAGKITAYGPTPEVLTTENIFRVYGVEPIIDTCAKTGDLRITFSDEATDG